MPQEPAASPAPSSYPEIPGYRLESVLGRGATGTVYRALQLAVDREVALKVLHPELGAKAVKRLQREARTTARLQHPGIVSAIDMGQVGTLWWYAMELVDGPALSTMLRERGRLGEREALRLFIPLCEALQHAHEHGVVHRDIKPANILVDGTGRARLVDLGLAFTEDDPQLTRTGGTLGTPHYLSPEQARNPQSVDVRSDIWSLGATMFHALCGRPPFAGESVAEILSGVLYAQIPDPRELAPDLSQGLALVLRKCLTRNPDRRYPTPDELLRDLEALRERRAVRVRARSLDPVAGAAERRRRNLWIATGALLAVASGILLYWRPWAAPAAPGGAQGAEPVSWEPLETILASVSHGDRGAPGRALLRLDELRDNIPPQYSPAYYTARSSIQDRFNSLIQQERQRIKQAHDRAVTQDRDFVRAAELVSTDVEEKLASEFGADDRQRDAVRRKLDLGVLRTQDAEEEADAVKAFIARVNERYEQVICPQVRQAQARGAWSDARELMGRDIVRVLDEAGISSRGLTPSLVQAHLDTFKLAKIKTEVDRLELSWREMDADLERAIVARAAAIESRLRGRELTGDASSALDAAYAAELATRSIVPTQMLIRVSDQSHKALEQARAGLTRLEQELLITDAHDELVAIDQQLAPAWKDRQYPKIAAAWQQRIDEAWLAPVRPQIEVHIQEAELLEKLLQRAADGLKAPGVKSIRVNTIDRPGRIEAGSDPLRDGFQLVIGGKPEAYAFRVPAADPGARLLGAPGIEQLAGLAGELTPVDRLTRAAFRFREGEPDTALKTFLSGPLPRESHGTLIADLEARLDVARGMLDAQVQEREKAAQTEYNLIQRGQGSGDVAVRIKRITDLLAQFGDTAVVREHEAGLKALREELLAPTRTSNAGRVQQVYGAAVQLLPFERVMLSYEFSNDELPHWKTGDWKHASYGWSAGAPHSRKELEEESLWPRFELLDPLDLDAQMMVEIVFDQPLSSGPPTRFIASIAGWHVGFAGPSELGDKAQIAATAGGPAALPELLNLLDKKQGWTTSGLERGSTQRLRIDLSQGRGKLRVTLNDVFLKEWDLKRPEVGGSALVLRSQEQVLLRSVRIETSLRK